MFSIWFILWSTLVSSSCGVYYAYVNYGPEPGPIATWMGLVWGWLGMVGGLLWVYLRTKPTRLEYKPQYQSQKKQRYQRLSVEV
jgi:hypothetical protein